MGKSSRLQITLAIGTLAVAQVACVTRGSFDAVEQERDRLLDEVAALAVEVEEVQGRFDATEAASSEQISRSAALIRELEAEVAAGEVRVRMAVDGVTIDMTNEIIFDSGSTDLSQSGRALLRRIAKQIATTDSVISVEGHTDSWMVQQAQRERYPTNWELGAARAAMVVKRLTAEGVDPGKLRVVSYGPFHPIAANDSPAGRRKNRRINIVLRSADP